MIISASRRTDIPFYYHDWLVNRLRQGYACVRNPYHPSQISRISLSQDVVDGIVLWTKNPVPMIAKLDELKPYPYYFQFTLNAYGKDIERNIPSKSEILIPAFHDLSRMIGKERVIWRYDPILLTRQYTLDYHVEYFGEIAKRLSDCTEKCVISFIDFYRNTQNQMREQGVIPMEESAMKDIAQRLAQIAAKHHIAVESCAEQLDLSEYGIMHGHCVDGTLFERLFGRRLSLRRDRNQRKECGCAESIDIGAYNTCENGCAYCYANYNPKIVSRNHEAHDPASPLLFGNIESSDIVKERPIRSCRDERISLIDLNGGGE